MDIESKKQPWLGRFLRWLGVGVATALLGWVVTWFTPLGEPAKQWTQDRMRAATAPMPAPFPEDRYIVLVADFVGDDAAFTQSGRLAEALAAQFAGTDLVQVHRLPRALRMSGSSPAAREKAEMQGRALLAPLHGDVLIWGGSARPQ